MYSSDYEKTTATGVPVSSPPIEPAKAEPRLPPPPKLQTPWSTGLFDCFSDPKNCCITWWCPCITFGQVAEIVDKGTSSCEQKGMLFLLIACVTGCTWFYSSSYRSKMRQQFSLQDQPCEDCLVHCCCESCALCQEYRELQNRGYNVSLGWHGNIEGQNRGAVAMAPLIESGMTR